MDVSVYELFLSSGCKDSIGARGCRVLPAGSSHPVGYLDWLDVFFMCGFKFAAINTVRQVNTAVGAF